MRLESRLQMVLEASGLGVWEYDHVHDRIIWNLALCQMTGYAPEQTPVTFADWVALIHPDDRPAVLNRVASALAAHNPLYAAEYRIGKQDGSWLWIAAKGRVVSRDKDGNPAYTVGTMEDISAWKHTELFLRAQHELAVVIANEPSREVLLKAILDSALTLPELDGGGIYWLQEDGSYAVVSHRGLSAEFIAAVGRLPPDSWQAEVIRKGDMRCSCRKPGDRCVDLEFVNHGYMVREGIRSLVVQPILANGVPLACLNLVSLHVAPLCAETLTKLWSLTLQFNQSLQRQLAQEEVANQRGNLRGLFDALDDYLFVLDLAGTILHCNSAVTKQLGYGPGLIGRPVWEVHPPAVREEARQIMADMVAGKQTHCPLPLQKATGEVVLADTRVALGNWDGKPAMFGISRDVTEQVRRQEALLRSETLLRTILDSTVDGILVIGSAGKVLAINQSFQSLWRIPSALAAEGLDEHLLAQVLDKVAEPEAFLREVRRLYQTDEQHWDTLVLKDGRIIERFTHTLQLDGKRARLWSFRDITERKQTETALRISQERLSYALQGSTDGLWDWNLETNAVYYSPRWKSMLGYAEHELDDLFATWEKLVHPEDKGRAMQFVANYLEGSSLHYEVEFRMRHKDGHWVDILARAKLACDTGGNPVTPKRLVGTHIDITERKRMETELKGLNDSLEQRVREESAKNREKDHLLIQQSRLAAMGEMIGNIAHQWRQPLNTLGLALANLEDAFNYNELTGEYLGKQVAEGKQLIQKMSSTIDDFRNFFRPHKEAEPFSAAQAINVAVSLVSASFRNNNISIALELGEDAFIQGFANEFSQVLLNLFANAKDAILQQHIADGKVSVRLARDGQWVDVTVADNGGGIPAGVMEKIFEPYFSTKERGTGIGLYMSKMIIENSMRGQINVCNRGNGAEFTVRCRLAGQPPGDADHALV